MGLITSTFVGTTDPGLVRKNNEDCFLLGYPRTGQRLADRCRVTLPLENNSILMVVSDGMGGARAGEIASRLTVEVIMQELPRLPLVLSPYSRLEAAIEAANFAIWVEQQQDSRLAGMGATVTAILIERDCAYVAEVGDSRAYLIRGSRIKQLTSDQTVLQALLDSGAITPEAAAKSIHRNILLQAMGQQEYLQIACSSLRIRPNDVFLLCSDGLSAKVDDQEIYRTIRQSDSLETASQSLIALAKDRGGEDNITSILARFEGESLKYQPESISRAMCIHSRFDPEQEAVPRRQRILRPAGYEDWVQMAVVDYFAHSETQRLALQALGNYGDYMLFRRGDSLIFHGESLADKRHHYWLFSGRYRLEAENEQGTLENVALIVPPTDSRTNEQLLAEYHPSLPLRRHFFAASSAMLHQQYSNVTIWCEDEENIAIRVPLGLCQQVAEILGSRFLNAIKYS
jgi:PPM family protein phosphatase